MTDVETFTSTVIGMDPEVFKWGICNCVGWHLGDSNGSLCDILGT